MKRFSLIKLHTYDNKPIYVNKEYIKKIYQNSADIIVIQLLNEDSIFTNEQNLDLLADKLAL